MKRLVVISFLSASLISGSEVHADDRLANAIHIVESGGRTGKIVGDGGKALGPLQIHYSNWKDAVDYDKTIGGKYSDCQSLEYSKKIFRAYLQRYASGKNREAKARIWNGGPSGYQKQSTKQYWAKVQANL